MSLVESLSIMLPCSKKAFAQCSNEEEKAQLLPEISTLNSCGMEKSDV